MTFFDKLPELQTWLQEHGEPKFRAGQIQEWLVQKRATSWEQMTNLPATLRSLLAKAFPLWNSAIAKHTTAEDGTEKLLMQMADGKLVECVLNSRQSSPDVLYQHASRLCDGLRFLCEWAYWR